MTSSLQTSRRNFLRGKMLTGKLLREKHSGNNAAVDVLSIESLRPPWSIDESLFTDQCQRCDACVESCETGLLVKGSGGFPEADYQKGFCTFCKKCVDACDHKALVLTSVPWQQKPEFTNTCLAANKVFCRTCEESCEVEAIRFQLKPGGIAQPELAPELCTGCGECIADCPVQALTMNKIQKQQPDNRMSA